MDKNALKRRNRLLKKNEARMNILLGRSAENDVEKEECKDKNKDTKQDDEEIYNEKNKKKEELKNAYAEKKKEEKKEPSNGLEDLSGKMEKEDSSISSDPSITPIEGEAKKRAKANERMSNNSNKNGENGRTTATEKEQNGDVITGKSNNKSSNHCAVDTKEKNTENVGANVGNMNKDPNEDDTADMSGESNANNSSAKKGNAEEGGDKENNDGKRCEELNNGNGSDKNAAEEEPLLFNIDIQKFVHFTLLIILSILFSIFKLQHYDYKNLMHSNRPVRAENALSRFLASKNFFIYFSFLYNMIFSIIDIYSYFKKNNISQKELFENIKNMRKKLKSDSEALLFLLNNGATVAFFFVNIVKSYVMSMFLTHLFDDILHTYAIRMSSANVHKTVA
ncbi:hypothetical protein POVWA2_007870 [Plasmodium ovale wallikeri]|uniref:Uncharacterized protein n=2 Tax=Plasmodium ovale TaxID=36330 RepID=A0A1A8YKQ0_PLAOA|nr:hypothetical protein POVWA2_007870 [Plasmodium ovale wallikeri]SBT32935.1 hypothetical protein POVWA1_014600 [Plasmodium ovale wallikeri]SBT75638.1 conserved Plasmodium protein, unknown function [Plasmodium ovale]